jgi:acetyltransferase EpsM
LNQKILILGNSILAEELTDVISEIPGYEVAGYVENLDPERCENRLFGLPIYWVDDIEPMKETHLCVCGISTTHRRKYIEQVQKIGMRFATIIHPTARVSAGAEIGNGCIIGPLSNVSYATVLGEHVFVNRGALIGHHSSIGSFTTIQPGATVAGKVTIGSGTYVAIGSTIIDRITVGQNCVIGAGSVVVKDVPDSVQVVGVPAKIVKTGTEGK